jgi:lactoylglutathione lyase
MPLKFAYTIIYVPNVITSIEFFEKAFGLQRRFIADGTLVELCSPMAG